MHRLVVLYAYPEDPEHFRDYYSQVHILLAAQLPGLHSMRYTLDVQALTEEAPYFAVWEGEFESADAMAAAMASPQGQAVVADLPNYASGGAQLIHYDLVEPGDGAFVSRAHNNS